MDWDVNPCLIDPGVIGPGATTSIPCSSSLIFLPLLRLSLQMFLIFSILLNHQHDLSSFPLWNLITSPYLQNLF